MSDLLEHDLREAFAEIRDGLRGVWTFRSRYAERAIALRKVILHDAIKFCGVLRRERSPWACE